MIRQPEFEGPSFSQLATVLLFEVKRYTGSVTSFDPSHTKLLRVMRGRCFKLRVVREDSVLVSTGNIEGDGARYAFGLPPLMVGLATVRWLWMTVKSTERSPWKAGQSEFRSAIIGAKGRNVEGKVGVVGHLLTRL